MRFNPALAGGLGVILGVTLGDMDEAASRIFPEVLTDKLGFCDAGVRTVIPESMASSSGVVGLLSDPSAIVGYCWYFLKDNQLRIIELDKPDRLLSLSSVPRLVLAIAGRSPDELAGFLTSPGVLEGL